MLDSSSMGSFTNEKIDAKWELLERIQRNTEDWEIDKGKESGINYEYDCIRSFVETASFNNFSAKFGLDSELLVGFLNQNCIKRGAQPLATQRTHRSAHIRLPPIVPEE